jgi:hypothetical protein
VLSALSSKSAPFVQTLVCSDARYLDLTVDGRDDI